MAIKAYIPGRHEEEVGIYTFFEMVAKNAVVEGERGVVAIPITADWGPVKDFTDIYDWPGAKETFYTGQSARLLQLAFYANPYKVKAYRMATNEAAKATLALDIINVTALYTGARANNFMVTIRPSLEDVAKKEFILTEGAIALKTIVFATVEELIEKASESYYIRIEKKTLEPGVIQTIPSNVVSKALSGGNSGANITTLDYAEFLNAASGEKFNWIVSDGVKDPAIKQMFIQFVKDYRPHGNLSKTCTGGLDATTIDYYSVTNVIQWAEKDGIKYTPEEVAIYIAAAAAACPLNESLAMKATPFDKVQKLSSLDTKKKIKEGNFILFQEGKVIRFNTPVNTMTTVKNFDSLVRVGDGSDEAAIIRTLRKIKTVEVHDYIAEAEEIIFRRFISKANSPARRISSGQMVKKELLVVLEDLEVLERGLSECIPDPRYHGDRPTLQAYKDEAYFVTSFTIIDAAEKIYNVNKSA